MEHRGHHCAAEQGNHGIACRLHPRRFRQAPLQIAVKAVDLGVFISCERGVDPENHQVMGIKTNIDAAQALQRSHQQPCANQHHDGKRHLRYNQRVANAEPFRASTAKARRRAVAFL